MKKSSKVIYHRKNIGFSLIELMIVLVIAGILMGIAVPSYARYVERSKRAAAYACLTQVSAVMEQVYADSFKYTVDLDGDSSDEFGNSSGVCNSTSSDCEDLDQLVGECGDQISNDYTLRLAKISAKTFTLIADTVSDDFDDACGDLSLAHNGKASASGTLGDECFSE